MIPKKRVYLTSYGCQMNEVDSERILARLREINCTPTEEISRADIILFNTCSIRQKAEHKVYSALGRAKRFKERNPRVIIGVGGCVAQQEGERLLAKIPYLDLVFGTTNIDDLPSLIRRVEGEKVQLAETSMRLSQSLTPIARGPHRLTAFVTISQGCDRYCSYCVVPFVRGEERSRPSQEVLQEIRGLVEKEVKEVTLLGQNVNAYGRKVPGAVTFPQLLELVDEIHGLERIRFTTSHPYDLTDELIACFGRLGKLCEHIHLPVQSGSNAILDRMNRRYTREYYLEKVARLRKVSPEVSITSDIIVGFPGETERDFEDTLDLMERVHFDDLFSFKYSDRPHTRAATLPEKVAEATALGRLHVLQEKQRVHSLLRNQRWEGRDVEVLVEGTSPRDEEKLTGRTRGNKVVHFRGSGKLVGESLPVRVQRASLHHLAGEWIVRPLTAT
jgi:tRNA-2-methylthio-N6-dimethylallyladenosine synthase